MIDDTAPPSSATPASQQPSAAAPRARLRELSPKTMWLTAVVIAVLTAGAVVVLWWAATRGLNGAELVTARLDALKIGLSIGVGSGGVVALYLSWRRQDSTERTLVHQQEVHAATMAHQDRVARATEHDAAERRLSELYLKAVEQLGSPEAAVRHGGLYALERVAQNNPDQRQTVVNVICAYLRGPYNPSPEPSGPRRLGVRRPLLRSTTAARTPISRPDTQARESRLQEHEVRLTAQRILQRHLRPDDNTEHPQLFWPGIAIDLAGATLIDFSFTNCRVAKADFRRTTFIGVAWFDRASFSGVAWFDQATFTLAIFSMTTFADTAGFSGATFAIEAGFNEVTFSDFVFFDTATFAGPAVFDRASFSGVTFGKATFAGPARFDQAAFNGFPAQFDGATHDGRPFNPVERGVSPHGDETPPPE